MTKFQNHFSERNNSEIGLPSTVAGNQAQQQTTVKKNSSQNPREAGDGQAAQNGHFRNSMMPNVKKDGIANQSSDMSPDVMLIKKGSAAISNSGSNSQNRQVINSYGGYTKIEGQMQNPTSLGVPQQLGKKMNSHAHSMSKLEKNK